MKPTKFNGMKRFVKRSVYGTVTFQKAFLYTKIGPTGNVMQELYSKVKKNEFSARIAVFQSIKSWTVVQFHFENKSCTGSHGFLLCETAKTQRNDTVFETARQYNCCASELPFYCKNILKVGQQAMSFFQTQATHNTGICLLHTFCHHWQILLLNTSLCIDIWETLRLNPSQVFQERIWGKRMCVVLCVRSCSCFVSTGNVLQSEVIII